MAFRGFFQPPNELIITNPSAATLVLSWKVMKF
jgi:hypothetical protein